MRKNLASNLMMVFGFTTGTTISCWFGDGDWLTGLIFGLLVSCLVVLLVNTAMRAAQATKR